MSSVIFKAMWRVILSRMHVQSPMRKEYEEIRECIARFGTQWCSVIHFVMVLAFSGTGLGYCPAAFGQKVLFRAGGIYFCCC